MSRRRINAGVPTAVALVASLVVPCAAQSPVTVTSSIEPDVATVGDLLLFVLEVEAAPGVRVLFPDIQADVAPFEAMDVMLAEPTEVGGRIIERRQFALAAFETGALTVPALEFIYVTAEGDSGVVLSDSLGVTIESVLPEVKEGEEVGPLDIKPPVELPRRVWPWIVLALGVAAAVAAFYYLRRWWRKRTAAPEDEKVEEPRVPRRAAHLAALVRLDALERDDPIGRGEIPFFYVRVTEIVRLYMRDRFGVDAIDMTTTELPPAMRAARMEEGDVEWAEGYLVHADLSKFAKHVPAEERARHDLVEAREFVERTRLHGEESEVAAGVGPGGDLPLDGADAGETPSEEAPGVDSPGPEEAP